MQNKIIWTIGHSSRSWQDFISLLQSFQISVLVDIRNFPGSRRYPHFNKEFMEASLPASDIRYIHLKDLGGRRKPIEGSINTAWRNAAFRGYADYIQTDDFNKAVSVLESIAMQNRTIYMCSEAVWWSCHRALVSDYFKWKAWKVMHIMGIEKATEHPYTKPAKIINGLLRYDEPNLFS